MADEMSKHKLHFFFAPTKPHSTSPLVVHRLYLRLELSDELINPPTDQVRQTSLLIYLILIILLINLIITHIIRTFQWHVIQISTDTLHLTHCQFQNKDGSEVCNQDLSTLTYTTWTSTNELKLKVSNKFPIYH